MLVCVVVNARLIVQTSMSAMSDQRPQLPKKLKRLRLNSVYRPSSLHNHNNNNNNINDDNDGGDDVVTSSWFPVVEDRRPTAVSTASDLDVVPDVTRLDFFRRYASRSRPFHGYSDASGTADHPVWRPLDGSAGGEKRARITGLVSRRSGDAAVADSWTFGRQRKMAILSSVVGCFVVALTLTLTVVWIRRRRRLLRTASPKPYSAGNTASHALVGSGTYRSPL